MSEELLGRCRDELRRAGAEPAWAERAARCVLGAADAEPLDDVLSAGIEAGLACRPVTEALARCERLVGRRLDADTAPAQRWLDLCAERGDPDADDARLRRQTVEAWHRGRTLEPFNDFRGFRTHARAVVEEWEDPYLTLERNPKLMTVIVAGDRGRHVFVATADPERSIKLELHGADDDWVVLRVVGVRSLPQGAGKRQRLRVMTEAAAFTVELPEGGDAEGRVENFSSGGLGLVFDARLPLAAGARLRCRGRLGVAPALHALELDAEVRWVDEQPGRTRLGLALLPGQSQRALLERLVRDYEQEAIRALSRLADDR